VARGAPRGVTEIPAISTQRPAAIGPGRLLLVIGPSGAGKDTLLGLAKAACTDDVNIVFPRRVVTREASSSEDNESLSPDAFKNALQQGAFAIHWEAHGHCYALPKAIDDDIRAGRTVVVNVSRMVVESMRCSYADVVVVSITAPPQILAERLAARARSSDGQIEARLRRIVKDEAKPDVTISNVGSAEYHARQLVRIIRDEQWDA
jgi:ribose 1,5-bisphosphokinase